VSYSAPGAEPGRRREAPTDGADLLRAGSAAPNATVTPALCRGPTVGKRQTRGSSYSLTGTLDARTSPA